MSGGEGALGEIRRALAGITHRLDALATAVGGAGTPTAEPAGTLLDERLRAQLATTESLLRIGRGVTAGEAILLAIDRTLSHARADCAALLEPCQGAPFRVILQRGFSSPVEVVAGEGIVSRAAVTAEIVQGGPGLGAPDALLDAHGLARAVAVPVPGPDGGVAGVLLAGRRRAVPFDAEALSALLVMADRVADALRRLPAEAAGHPSSGRESDLGPVDPDPPVTRAPDPVREDRPPQNDAPRGTPQTSLTDMANLLAVVVGRLAAVRERVTDPNAAGDLGIAEDAAWRAAEAVRRVLGFAPGSRDLHATPLDLAVLVRETVMSVERRWGAEGREPAVSLDLQAVPFVRGNAEELRHALDHLLQNAREASDASAPITLRLRWDGGLRVELAVSDEGRGMDTATEARASDPFFTTKGPGRLGVGLAIARATATRHRGQLEVDSIPGRGTTVRLHLPIAPGAGTPTPRRPAAAPVGPRTDGVRVLVVEDEPTVRDVLVQGLEQSGAVVRTAEDVRGALTLIEHAPVDAVVTDLALPGGSGLEVARQARRLRPGAAIVLMTGWPGRVDPETLETHGVDAVIEKPVGLETLRATLATLLARSAPPSG